MQFTDEQVDQTLSNMSEEQLSMTRRMLIRDAELSGKIKEPEIGDKIAYGWSKIPYTLNKINEWGKDKLTEWFTEKAISRDEDKLEIMRLQEDPDLYNYHKAQIEKTHERWRNNYGEHLIDLKITTDMESMSAYPNIFGTRYDEDLSTQVGTLAKYMADPTTVAPIGSGFKLGAAIGGLVAAHDNVWQQLYEKGTIDEGELALISSLGAVGGGIVAWGGKRISDWLLAKKRKGEPVTPRELMEKFGIDPDQKRLTGPVSRGPGEYRGASYDAFRDTSIYGPRVDEQVPLVNALVPEPRGSSQRQRAITGPTVGQKALPAPQWEVDQRLKTANLDKMAEFINTQFLGQRAQKANNTSLDIFQEFERRQALDEIELEELKKLGDTVATAAKKRQMDADFKAHRETMDQLRHNEVQARNAAFKTYRTQGSPDDPALWKRDFAYNQQETIERLDSLHNSTAAIARKLGVHPKDVQEVLSGSIGNQGGFASEQLIKHMFGAFVGGTAGAMYGDESMALLGAIGGATAPLWISKIPGSIGKLNETVLSKQWRANNTWAATFTSPETFLRAIKDWGGTAADKLHVAEIAKTRIIATSLNMINRSIRELQPGMVENFIATMQGSEKPMSKQVAKAAADTKKMFQRYARLAYETGVINKKQYAKMLQSHYWPRIWNERYLESKEGHDRFLSLLTDIGFSSPEQGKRIIGSLVRDPDKIKVEQFTVRKNKDGSIAHILTKEQANTIMLQRNRVSTSKRSTHMDHTRKLHPDDEKVLNEFLIKDPMTVITEYGNDVGTRVAFAKQFGPNDEYIAELQQKALQVGEKEFKRDVDYFTNLYYTALGDSRSSQIAKQLGLSEGTRRVLGSVNAFETLKLSLAQVLNMSQATVNGLTFAAKHGGTRALRTYIKGVKGIMSKEGREFAERSGAALETTIMQLLTENSANATVLGMFGKTDLDGPLKALNMFNNPSVFLQNTGFLAVERIQRMLAANQGKALYEEAWEMFAKVQDGTTVGAKAAIDRKKAIEIAEGMGLNERALADRNPIRMKENLEIAALEFSNRVNHTNNYSRLPPWARGPYARTILKFKSFMFHQAAFIKDNVLAPAMKAVDTNFKEGSIQPLAAYIGVGSMFGMTTDEIRRFIKSDDSKLSNTERMLRGISAVGALGLWYDTAQQLATNNFSGSTISLLLGPAASDAYNMYRATIDSVVERSGDPIIRQSIKSTLGSYPGKQYLLDHFRDGPRDPMVEALTPKIPLQQ